MHLQNSKTFAKQLRKNQTNTEKFLWQRLRNRQIVNAKFRRQQVIGKYIVDFVCFEEKIIIELDGSQHNTLERKAYDKGENCMVRKPRL